MVGTAGAVLRSGVTGPEHVERSMAGKTVRARGARSPYNANTKQEWDTAMGFCGTGFEMPLTGRLQH